MIINPFETLETLARANQNYLESLVSLDLTNGRESSMGMDRIGDSLYGKIHQQYHHRLPSRASINTILTQIKDYCRSQFLEEHPHLPFEVSGELTLHSETLANGALHSGCAECDQIKLYLESIPHTAYRTLACPNPLINPFAPHAAAINRRHLKTHIAFNEDQIKKIALFWLTASDPKAECVEGFTAESLKQLFLRALALVGRAHNWDHTRVVSKAFKRDDGQVYFKDVEEEYDDGRLDNPSCGSGIHRRLNQSLIGHKWFQQQKIKVGEYLVTEVSALLQHSVQDNLTQWKGDFKTLEVLIDNYVIEIFGKQTTYVKFVDEFVEDCLEYGIEQKGKKINITDEEAHAFGQLLKAMQAKITLGFSRIDKDLSKNATKEYKRDEISKHGNKKFTSFHQFFTTCFLNIQPSQIHDKIAQKLHQIRTNQKEDLLQRIELFQVRHKALSALAKRMVLSIETDSHNWLDDRNLMMWLDKDPILSLEDKKAVVHQSQAHLMRNQPDFSILPKGRVHGKHQFRIAGDGNCLFTSMFIASLEHEIPVNQFNIEDPHQLREFLTSYISETYMASITAIDELINLVQTYTFDRRYALFDLNLSYDPSTAEGLQALRALISGDMPAQIRGFFRGFLGAFFSEEALTIEVDQFCQAVEYVQQLHHARLEYNDSFGTSLDNAKDYISQMAKDGTWGGEFEIYNFCKFFRVLANVIKQSDALFQIQVGPHDAGTEISLLHCQDNHYHPLVDKNNPNIGLLDAFARHNFSRLSALDTHASLATKAFVKSHFALPTQLVKSDFFECLLETEFKKCLKDYKSSFHQLKTIIETKAVTDVAKFEDTQGYQFDLDNDSIEQFCLNNMHLTSFYKELIYRPIPEVRNAVGLTTQDVLLKPLLDNDKAVFLMAHQLGILTLESELTLQAAPYTGPFEGWSCCPILSGKITHFAQTSALGGTRRRIGVTQLTYNAAPYIEHNLAVITANGVGGRTIKLDTWQLQPMQKTAEFEAVKTAITNQMATLVEEKKIAHLQREVVHNIEFLEFKDKHLSLQQYIEEHHLPLHLKREVEMLPNDAAFIQALPRLMAGETDSLAWPRECYLQLKNTALKKEVEKNLHWNASRRQLAQYTQSPIPPAHQAILHAHQRYLTTPGGDHKNKGRDLQKISETTLKIS